MDARTDILEYIGDLLDDGIALESHPAVEGPMILPEDLGPAAHRPTVKEPAQPHVGAPLNANAGSSLNSAPIPGVPAALAEAEASEDAAALQAAERRYQQQHPSNPGLAAWPEASRPMLRMVSAGRSFLVCAAEFGPARDLGLERVQQLAAAGQVQSGKGKFRVVPAGRCLEPMAQFSGDEHVLVHILGTELVLACATCEPAGDIPRQSVRWRAHRSVHPTVAGIHGEGNLPVLDTDALIRQLTPRQL